MRRLTNPFCLQRVQAIVQTQFYTVFSYIFASNSIHGRQGSNIYNILAHFSMVINTQI
jgi:hypothetical protein